MKKILKYVAVSIGVIIIIFSLFVTFINWGQRKVTAVKINYIDLSKINDGEYIGSFDGYRWSNTVKVTILNNKITSISFVKGQTFRIKEFEDELINRVIDKQSVQVDTIAGSTISSKAILKAIENALEK